MHLLTRSHSLPQNPPLPTRSFVDSLLSLLLSQSLSLSLCVVLWFAGFYRILRTLFCFVREWLLSFLQLEFDPDRKHFFFPGLPIFSPIFVSTLVCLFGDFQSKYGACYEIKEKTWLPMKSSNSWIWFKKKNAFSDGGKGGLKMKQLSFMGVVCTVMLFIVYRTTNYQNQAYRQTEMEEKLHPFNTVKEILVGSKRLDSLPRGIIHARSDLERRPLWLTSSSKVDDYSNRNLLAIPVGIKQKDSVDAIVQKFLPENFTIILFHYDGSVDGWWDLEWSNEAIHIVAQNQTKWWFAKRFLHPDVVSIYDYIFLWDEDLGVENFDPGRYLQIVKEAGLEISQPALNPNSTDIHHRITIRARTKKFHRRVYDIRGSVKCTEASQAPPCTGFVEGMAPVFSRSAWHCTWHLIQNDLVHGWGLDMKLGYCAQGDRTKKVGVVDREYIVHKGIQTLGGGDLPAKKVSNPKESSKKHVPAGHDGRTEIRRQSTREFKIFKERWNRAVEEDTNWSDPFISDQRRRRQRKRHNH